MRFDYSVPQLAPLPPYDCELIEVDTQAIPFMLGGLYARAKRRHWITDEDATRGRQLLAKQGVHMLMGCKDEIVTAINQLYRLTDVVHNGTVYSYTGTGTTLDPYVYNPPIPVVPARTPGLEPSEKFSLEKLLRLQDNLVNGTTYTDAPDDRNLRQQLADILEAIQGQETLDPEILAELVQILAALA